MAYSFDHPVNFGEGMRAAFSRSGRYASSKKSETRHIPGQRSIQVTLTANSAQYHQVDRAAEVWQERSAAMLRERLNNVVQEPAYAWMFAIGGIALAFALVPIQLPLSVLALTLGITAAIKVHEFDRERRSICLDYQWSIGAQQRWESLKQSLYKISNSEKIWRITSNDIGYDWKRRAGAAWFLDRTPVTLTLKSAPHIQSEVIPYCLSLENQHWYFYPDSIYIWKSGAYRTLSYANITVSAGETQFLEEEKIPAESTVVGKTWRYVNRSGEPCRKSNNHEIPRVAYGAVEFKTTRGMEILLHTSSAAAAQQFAKLFPVMRKGDPETTSHKTTEQTTHCDSSRNSHNRTQREAPTTSTKVSASCYETLGLMPNCTREEAMAKYRTLALAYHPDQVSTLAPEFRELATSKMQEINVAYSRLKRLHNW